MLLVGGGSGIVPLMAMLRQRVVAGSADFRLVYSVRSPADVYYAEELVRLERECGWLLQSNWSTRARPHLRPPDRPAGSATVTSRRPGACPIMAHASTFAVQRDSWNR